MEITPESVKKYLKNREKLYLKILHKLMTKSKDDRGNQVRKCMDDICKEIKGEQLNYDELTQIMPVLEKDQRRLTELVSREVFEKIQMQIEYIGEKI